MAKPPLVMTGPLMRMVEEQLDQLFEVQRLVAAPDRGALLAKLAGSAEAMAAGFAALKVDAPLMDRLPKLKIIANFGVGYDAIDARAAAARGIVVTNTPDVLTEETADTALGLLIMTARELSKAEAYLRAGRWAKEGPYRLTPNSLRDRSIGIVGLGRIGKAIARRCAALGIPIAYHGRHRQTDVDYRYYPDLIAMAREVDTLIVVIPAGPATEKLIGAAVFEALGPRGVVINIARGSVVDEPALIAALKKGTIAAAGLDVMLNEPDINPELIALDNAVLLPHVGSASLLTRNRMGQLVVDNLKAFLERRPPLTPVPETPFKGWS